MKGLITWLFDVRAYQGHPVDALRALLVYALNAASIVVLLFVTFLLPVDGTPRLLNLAQTPGAALEVGWALGLIVALAVSFVLVRIGRLQWGAGIVLATGMVTLATISLEAGFTTPLEFLGIPMMMILATVLLGTRSAIGVNTALISIYVAVTLSLTPSEHYRLARTLYGLGALLVLALMMAVIRRMISLARQEGSTEADEERLKLAEINSFITRKAAERAPLQETLNDILQMLLQYYPDFYHAQVFLLDEGELRAQLAASTGSTGEKLIGEKHGLAVGSRSIIGQVTLQSAPVIEEAGREEGFHRPNPALPLTRLEAAFPMRVDDRVIGALDLQSQRTPTLDENDIQAFQSVADSLSLAIDNYRQIEIAQKRAEDNRKLVAQTQNALREVERLNQRLIGSAWAEYLQDNEGLQGFDVDLATEEISPASSWTATLADAVTVNTIIQDGNTIAMPLRIRGHVIGAIEFDLPEGSDLSPEDLELVREISDRFGLAAENTRLLEESLKAAQRESLINEISRRLQSASNVETTLTAAARSLRSALEAHKVAIRLGKPEPRNARSNGKKVTP